MHITDSSYWIRGRDCVTWRPKNEDSITGTDSKFTVRDQTGIGAHPPTLSLFKAYRLLYVPPGLTLKNFAC